MEGLELRCERCGLAQGSDWTDPAICTAHLDDCSSSIIDCRNRELATVRAQLGQTLTQLVRARQLLLDSVDAIDAFLAEEQGPCGNDLPGALESAGSNANAIAAATGGRSHRNTSHQPTIAAAGSPENAARVAATDGWQFDDSNPLGHRVCRSIQLGDLQLVLTIGEADDGGPTCFEVSPAALRWLLTGSANG